jgi:drug/metabolite transporter (DMT)-like permease
MALAALIAMTAVWGVTFVQVKDAVALYPLFAFLAVRFAIATVTLAVPGTRRVRSLGRTGVAAATLLGLLLAAGYALQNGGSRADDRLRHGVHHGHVRRAHAADRACLLPLAHRRRDVGGVLLERFAPRYDVVAFTLVEMAAACAGLGVVALARGELGVPHGWTVWGALVVTGVFASAAAFLVQTWAQRRTSATRTALAFTMEPVFAALFGFTLAGDRLGALGWMGCAAIMAGVLLAEPAAGDALRKVLRLA